MSSTPVQANDPADMLAAALGVAARGRRVAPIYEILADGSCACAPGGTCVKGSPGKHPRLSDHLNKATTDPHKIRAWWTQWPTANIAVVTGTGSGVVVIDLDTAEGHGEGRDGIGKFLELATGHGDDLNTEIVLTPSGGRHLYYKAPETKLQSASGRLAKGVDQRCEDGYVLVPPSNHVLGGRYETSDNGAELAPLPEWLAAKMTKAVAEPSSGKPTKAATLEQIQHATALVAKSCEAIASHPRGSGGGRTEVLLPKLKAMGGVIWALGETAVYQAAREAVARRGSSLPESEIERHIKQGLAHGAETPLALDVEPVVPEFGDAPPDPTERLSLADRYRKLGQRSTKHPTGIATLDRATRGGLRPGNVVVVGGAPGACKTSLVVQQAVHHARRGVPVAVLACDEGPEGLAIRIGQILGLGREDLEEGRVSEQAAALVSPLPLDMFSVDEPGVTIESVAASLGEKGPGVLVIDSLQTARTKTSGKADGPRARLDDVVAAIKSVATRHGHIVLVTSEVGRASYRNKEQAEQINDLAAFKESGSIEYAGTVLLVLRNPKDGGGLVDVTVPKNRLGFERPDFRLEFDQERATLQEVAVPPPAPKETEQARHARLMREIWTLIHDAPGTINSERGVCRAFRDCRLKGTESEIRDAFKSLKAHKLLSTDQNDAYMANPWPATGG